MQFFKYQATGNDFILLDNRDGTRSFSASQIQALCHRKFGIGADGLILLERETGYDFHINYYNADGSKSLCGNGSRAAVRFARDLGLITTHASMTAYDGEHEADILPSGVIRLKMNDVATWQTSGNDYILNTGSPHYVRLVNDVEKFSVYEEGKKIRYDKAFQPNGINANFVEILSDKIFVRTYERGVEDETLSCGTGITASALASHLAHGLTSPIAVQTLGGNLTIEFTKTTNGFSNIYLCGGAEFVFKGELK